ncbi:MAG: hypothetical protein ACRDOE_26950 [Streptosporangiaceae bacterium]
MRDRSRIVLFDQHRALPEQAVVTLDDQVDGPVEQGVAWRHVLGQRPALRGDETFLEGHTLIPAHQGSSHTDLAITETQFSWDVADLEPARFTFPNDSADVRESRQEEGADEVLRALLPGGRLDLRHRPRRGCRPAPSRLPALHRAELTSG